MQSVFADDVSIETNDDLNCAPGLSLPYHFSSVSQSLCRVDKLCTVLTNFSVEIACLVDSPRARSIQLATCTKGKRIEINWLETSKLRIRRVSRKSTSDLTLWSIYESCTSCTLDRRARCFPAQPIVFTFGCGCRR